jgi:hypothetical protein
MRFDVHIILSWYTIFIVSWYTIFIVNFHFRICTFLYSRDIHVKVSRVYYFLLTFDIPFILFLYTKRKLYTTVCIVQFWHVYIMLVCKHKTFFKSVIVLGPFLGMNMITCVVFIKITNSSTYPGKVVTLCKMESCLY